MPSTAQPKAELHVYFAPSLSVLGEPQPGGATHQGGEVPLDLLNKTSHSRCKVCETRPPALSTRGRTSRPSASRRSARYRSVIGLPPSAGHLPYFASQRRGRSGRHCAMASCSSVSPSRPTCLSLSLIHICTHQARMRTRYNHRVHASNTTTVISTIYYFLVGGASVASTHKLTTISYRALSPFSRMNSSRRG